MENLAEINASAGRIEEAIGHLAHCVALGYPDKEGMRHDPDFVPLQGHPRCEALIENL